MAAVSSDLGQDHKQYGDAALQVLANLLKLRISLQ